MEPYYILADYVHVRRPVFFVTCFVFPVRVIAYTRYIIGKSVQPDVNDVLIVEINGNPPFK